MNHVKSALGISPNSKNKPCEIDPAIFSLISKVPNADNREALENFFKSNLSKPSGCPHVIWNLLSGFADLFSTLAQEITARSDNLESSELLQEPSEMNSDTWATVTKKGRRPTKRARTEEVEIFENSIESHKQPQYAAMKEAERIRSVVICHFPESTNSNHLEAEKEDDANVRQMIYKLSETSKVEKLYRMGKKTNERMRLVKVVLCTTSMQRAVLSNAKNLRNFDDYKKVYIRKSMTKEELVESNRQRAALRYLKQIDNRWVIFRNDFWIREEIGKNVNKTVAPTIPENVFAKIYPNSSETTTKSLN